MPCVRACRACRAGDSPLSLLPTAPPASLCANDAQQYADAFALARYDGQFLLTAGGSDYTVNLWAIQPTALEAAAVLGGEGLTP